MSQLQTFVQAIITYPDDDAPRLAYAEALEHYGDLDRAEFIRVQCALATLPSADPRRPELELREAQLLERYGWEWAEPFANQIQAWAYGRGFIERIQINLEQPHPPLETLLNQLPLRYLREVSQVPNLAHLVSLLPRLEGLHGLEFWALYQFDSRLMRRLLTSPHLANLRSLILRHDRNGNMLSEWAMLSAINSPHRARVEELAIGVDDQWRGPSNRTLRAIAESPHLRNLRNLHLSNPGDTGNMALLDLETARLLGQSPNLANLEELDLSSASAPLEVWDEILRWPFLPKLKKLWLSYARQIEAPGEWQTLAYLKDLPQYRHALESMVVEVDWDSPQHSYWAGNASWQGLDWRMPFRRLLFAMQQFISAKDAAGLERRYRELCVERMGLEKAQQVDELPFDRYERGLAKALEQAIERIPSVKAASLCLRIWPDSGGRSRLDLQAHDPSLSDPKEEYSHSSPVSSFLVPDLPHSARIYLQNTHPKPNVQALYALARIATCLMRCLERTSSPIPAYFSCLNAVFRV